MSIAKVSKLEEWQKREISFGAEEVPEGCEYHDNPLVVRLQVYLNMMESEDEKEEDSFGLR